MECKFNLPSGYGLSLINIDLRFLLAQLHMDLLLSKSRCGSIKLALQNLPRGIQGLDTTYEQRMKIIDGQEEDSRALAKQVLSWITHAKRPLATVELQHALAVGDGAVELNEDFFPEVEDLVSVCAGSVSGRHSLLTKTSTLPAGVHYTKQEYFERTWIHWIPHAQTDIASVCLTYLSLYTFAA